MHCSELAAVYQPKTDEELLLLARDLAQLTTEARSCLMGELTRRRMEVPQSAAERNGLEPLESQEAKSSRWLFVEDGKFLKEVVRIYWEHSFTFTKITAPAVIVGYCATQASRWEGRAIVQRYTNTADMLQSSGGVAQVLILGIAAYLLSWVAFSFSFAVTSVVVEQIRAKFEPSIWDCVREVRKNAASVLAVAALVFLLIISLDGVMSWALTWISLKSRAYGVRLGGLAVGVLFYSLYAAIVLCCSRLSLAIPAIVLDDLRAGRAIFLSDELTEGKWTILGALLAKSVLGGYIAARFPYWIASLLPAQIWSVWWSPYVLTFAALGGVIAVEPLMFIGFALLYLETSAKRGISSLAAIRTLA